MSRQNICYRKCRVRRRNDDCKRTGRGRPVRPSMTYMQAIPVAQSRVSLKRENNHTMMIAVAIGGKMLTELLRLASVSMRSEKK